MTTMHRLLVLALFFVVALDFSTPDAVLAVGGARSVQWDDEEESVPARRQRVDGEERRVAVFPVVPQPGESTRSQSSTERRLHVARLNGLASTWKVPLRHAPTSSARSASCSGSASSSDDH